VPSEERTTKSAERCDLHPGRASVARCDGCGRPLCLACATPVRGRVLGAECLAEALGPDSPAPDLGLPRSRMSRAEVLTGATFALAVAATLLPWARFGEGSGPFGAWSRSFRWSMVAAVAGALGLATWVLRSGLRRGSRGLGKWTATSLAGLVTAGSALAILNPPSFTRPWVGAWLALLSGLASLTVPLSARRTPGAGAAERS
jgi:hypothetical protein